MDKDNLWRACEHILAGSANEILLRRDNKIALCTLCTVILPVEDLHPVYESQLMKLIKRAFYELKGRILWVKGSIVKYMGSVLLG